MSKAEERDIEEPALPRRRAVPAKLDCGTPAPKYFQTPKQLFRAIYCEALDLIVSLIKDSCEQLLLKAAACKDAYKDEFQTVTSFYVSDFDPDFDPRELEAHLSTFTHNILCVENETLSNVLAYLRSLSSHQQQLLSQVIKLAKLILVMPATNASSKRSFSALHRVKTYLRTRLNHLMLLYVHKDKTSVLCMVEIANDFVRESKYRLGVFGKFFSSDLADVQATVREKSTQTKVSFLE